MFNTNTMLSNKQMNRLYSIGASFLISVLVALAGCKARDAASNNALPPSTATSSSTNANRSAQTGVANRNASPASQPDASATAKPGGPAELLGTYESREVEDKGVTTLISQLKTLWLFSADGTYSRVAEVKGKPYHADSGKFRIEPPDKLVLTIQQTGLKTQRKIQNPPLSKTHKFSLSPDGEELRLTSEKGSVGIFRRVAKPKTS